MGTINDIFRSYGPEYMDRFKDSMPPNHLKVIRAIVNCKTQTLGATLYQCDTCGKPHLFFRSCGNRHCPSCQNHSYLQIENKIRALVKFDLAKGVPLVP